MSSPPAVAAVDADLARYRRTTLIAGGVSVVVYLWLQVGFLGSRVFSNFYDIQARALLDGNLAVPTGSLGNEAFRVRGEEFLYNPPGPSLLRLPLFLVTDRFDGRLTVLSMLAGWILTLVLVAALVWRVRRMVRGSAPLPTWELWAHGVFLVSVTVGSTLLYLASVPWVFHEAYLWSTPMAIGTAFALLGVLERPSVGRIVATGAFTLGVVMTRTTAGWACAVAVLVTAGWMAFGRRGAEAQRRWVAVAVAGALPVLVGMAINWLKFRHPWDLPFENQLYAARMQSRREVLALTEGFGFSPRTLVSTVPAYLRPDGIRFTGIFPFVTLPAEPAPAYGGVVLDNSFRTGSILTFMPGLVALALVGSVAALRRGAASLTRFPLLGMVLIPGAVMAGPYITHRYTVEFLPWMAMGGAVGLVVGAEFLTRRGDSDRRWALGALGALAAFGLVANLGLAMTNQALNNPGPVLEDLVARQAWISGQTGHPLDDRVVASAHLPPDGPADELHVVGECQALYIGTGEGDRPWIEVANRPHAVRLTRSDRTVSAGALTLAEFEGHHRGSLDLEWTATGDYRVVHRGGGLEEEGDWVHLEPGSVTEVRIEVDDPESYEVTGLGARDVLVPKQSPDVDFVHLPNALLPVAVTPEAAADAGVVIAAEAGPPSSTCTDLLDRRLTATEDPDL